MTLTVNGQDHHFEDGELPLAELIQHLGLQGQPLLIEHNGQALHPAAQQNLTLQDGDQLELLRLVAGG